MFADMESIRRWRNDQISVLRQKKILSVTDQNNYFNNVVSKLFSEDKPTQLLFALLNQDVLIGYGGLVSLDWIDRRAELSFLVDTDRANDKRIYEKDISNFIQLMTKICFTELGFNKLFTETYEFREFHISNLEKCGFIKEGKMREHILEGGKFYDSILHSILRDEYGNSEKIT